MASSCPPELPENMQPLGLASGDLHSETIVKKEVPHETYGLVSHHEDTENASISDQVQTHRQMDNSVFPNLIDEDDEVIFVKEIRKDPLPLPPDSRKETIMAAQRALILGAQSKGVGIESNGSLNSQTQAEDDDEHRRNKKRRREYNPIFPVGDRSLIDAAMRDEEEDHSWMEAGNVVDEQYIQMQTRLAELQRKQQSGKITAAEIVEFDRLANKLKLKDRLRTAANMDDESDGDGIFVRDSREDIQRRHRRNAVRRGRLNSLSPSRSDSAEEIQHPDDDNEDATLAHMLQDELDGNGLESVPTPKQLEKSRKPRQKAAKTAREWNTRNNERIREKERDEERKKELRKKGRAVANSKKKGAGRATKSARKGNGKGKGNTGRIKSSESLLRSGTFNRMNGADDIGQMILEDLMSNDPIGDRLRDPVFASGPELEIIGRQRKNTQLQRLLANIPEESNVDSARDDKAKLKLASQSFGYAKVKAVDGKWLIKGMISTLYHHQLLGAQWMVSRELSSEPPHGGLLADSMGLGKTIQTLACMIGNPPSAADKQRGLKTTLIVAPGAVIQQWLDEIRYHAEKKPFPKIMHYRARNNIPLEVLEDLDIVVTSYTEVMKQFPFPDDRAREEISTKGYKKWWKQAVKGMGDLHKVNWYRVVLDEAHAIKNNSARTSLACQNLNSVYRWCLTGTPLLNRLEE